MTKKITKAIFPLGGLGTRFLPASKAIPKEMLTVVDKPLIQYAVEEAAAAGIEEFIFVIGTDKSTIKNHFGSSPDLEKTLLERGKTETLEVLRDIAKHGKKITYVPQPEPAGLGHAINCANHLIDGEHVAVLLADDLILPQKNKKPCLAEMISAWENLGSQGNMLAAIEVAPSEVSSYGIISSKPSSVADISEVTGLVEKPEPKDAPSTLAVIGRYIIEPEVFTEISKTKQGSQNEIQLTDALAKRIGAAPFYALTTDGIRYDCGSKLGFVKANLAYALRRSDLSDALKNWLREQDFS